MQSSLFALAAVAALALPVAKYEPGAKDNHLYKIVDKHGHNSGFSTFVDEMLKRAVNAGARIELKKRLVSIGGTASAPALHFSDGTEVKPKTVLLNLPQIPLLRVLAASPSLLNGSPLPAALAAPSPIEGTKLYVYYEDAWWRNSLGLKVGSFDTDGSSSMRNTTLLLKQRPALFGRYHDGDVRCDASGRGCRGFLEATYAFADAARWFLTPIAAAPPEAEGIYTVLNRSSAAGAWTLDQVHEALLEFHRSLLENVSTPTHNASAAVAAMKPKFALLSLWGAHLPNYGGAVHTTKRGSLVTVDRVAPEAMAPFGDTWPVYVANEAFGALRGSDGVLGGHHGWAECSLVMAENVLVQQLGLPPAPFVSAPVYNEYVKYNATRRWQ